MGEAANKNWTGQYCPECGGYMIDDDHIHCAQCGYDEGSGLGGICPSCTTPYHYEEHCSKCGQHL
jgi:ribosomal protein S27AE